MNEELIAAIRERYQKGETRTIIKSALMEEGYEEEVIDSAIAYIQKEALKSLPGISTVLGWFEKADHHTATSSPKFIALTILGSLFIVLIISFVLYFTLDPLGTRSTAADKQRETDFVKIRTALENYNVTNKSYPASLSELTPKYLSTVPRDPRTGANYTYRSTPDKMNYTFCVRFDVRADQCISSAPEQSVIPVVLPTEIPSARETTPDSPDATESAQTPVKDQSL